MNWQKIKEVIGFAIALLFALSILYIVFLKARILFHV